MEIKGIVRDLPRIEVLELQPPKWLRPSEPSASESPYADFGRILSEVISQVNEAQQHSAELAQRFARGEPVDEQTLILAMERASLAFQLTLQVRNKVLEAYQELMRLQV
ncbi:MAG: flagellar hook-basal body complex protein FliE [Armatimonadota bacterium]|nr:flagellar hook-basal body complex protein FliE [Armatimonadota bacterium]MDW8106633.1 flagellar hook-basal body complex protein FliE [Armatimonadota bacterium]